MTELPTRFDAAEVEPRIGERWRRSGLEHPDPLGDARENFSIVIPPPNVTGALHMGHALNGAIQDTVVRYQRMRGRRTKWVVGTDHAGIATQTQVERALSEQGSSRQELGREAFVARVWDWRSRFGGTIIEQLKRLGASCDYLDERFTLDDGYVEAVQRVFVALYDRGLIYRDNYLVNWDPGSRSAISDLEVEEREVTDRLYEIAYPLIPEDGPGGGGSTSASGSGAGGSGSGDAGELVVATVRPETMLADTAIAVNPADERHRHLIGRRARLPLVGRELPIVGDDYVRTDFGTGVLKVTPGHDPNDFEIGRRHGLETISVIGEDGRMTPAAGEAFAGLTVAAAQRAVIESLEQEGLLRGSEPYEHTVPFSHRSGQRIEPLISLQWFMRMDTLAVSAAEVVRDGRVRIHPDSQARRYEQWLAEIRPWCISRQLWWGHQLPVWYCAACEETFVGMAAPERCGACGDEVRRDPDVLDTWFSSALWPFATLGWPQETPELHAFFPTDLLVTARDILFLWVARMVMMSLQFTGEVPFSDVYVHSVIQAPDGRRMSKSLGTGIDPVAEIDRHGADGVRFGLLAMSSSQDVRYSAEKVQQGQGLANKLFNASRFVLGAVGALELDPRDAPVLAGRPTAIEDRWILSRLEAVKHHTASRIEAYDFSHAALGLYDFIYGELCDWYVELVKARLTPGGPGAGTDRTALAATLLVILRETVALAHPVIPFVTEELWAHLAPAGEGLLMGASWPSARPERVDEAAESALARVVEAVVALRAWRDSVGLAPRHVVSGVLHAADYEETVDLVARMARIELQEPAADDAGAQGPGPGPVSSTAPVAIPGGSVLVTVTADMDLGAAQRRGRERRARLEGEIARAKGKLANAGFVSKAPAAVVADQRARLTELTAALEAL